MAMCVSTNEDAWSFTMVFKRQSENVGLRVRDVNNFYARPGEISRKLRRKASTLLSYVPAQNKGHLIGSRRLSSTFCGDVMFLATSMAYHLTGEECRLMDCMIEYEGLFITYLFSAVLFLSVELLTFSFK